MCTQAVAAKLCFQGGTMYCYCLFCETVKCTSVVREAEIRLDCRAIYPRQVQHIRKQGHMIDVEHALLPGYVFLYAEDAPLDFSFWYRLDGVLRVMRDQDGVYELTGADEDFALMILQKNGVIGRTKVYQEGQRIRLKEGVYQGLQTVIRKVDRRNGRMQIEIPFAGMQVKTWVEYEMVEEDRENNGE